MVTQRPLLRIAPGFPGRVIGVRGPDEPISDALGTECSAVCTVRSLFAYVAHVARARCTALCTVECGRPSVNENRWSTELTGNGWTGWTRFWEFHRLAGFTKAVNIVRMVRGGHHTYLSKRIDT